MKSARYCSFTVHGRPVPLERARHGRNGNIYTPTRSVDYQQLIWMSAVAVGIRQNHFGDAPLSLFITAALRPPQKPTPGRKAWPPDLDNIVKQVMDGLRPAYRDDCQIVRITAEKIYRADEWLSVAIQEETGDL